MVSYTLRVPDELYARIAAAADREHRSIHGQILWLLEHALDEPEQPQAGA